MTYPLTGSRYATVLALFALAACGGGGGGGTSVAPTAAPAPAATSSGAVANGNSVANASTAAPSPAAAPSASPKTLTGTDQDDTLEAPGTEAVVMVGGRGNDIYRVRRADDQVVEKPGEGIDEIQTDISFTLPDNVENMSVRGPGTDNIVLAGNALNNHIVGAPFSYEEIYGMDGDDVLDGGGRHGALLDGGNGNDRLILSFGEMRGGPGADTFVAGGRGAMTSPDAPITVLDFNGAQGDRIEIAHVQTTRTVAELWASGALRFDPATSTLTLDMDPATTAPTSVDQVFILRGVQSFDQAWVTVHGPTP